jgi:photosystem I subunit X
VVASTTLALVSGRFGLAPTTTKNANAGLKLVDTNAAGLVSNDPAGTLWARPSVVYVVYVVLTVVCLLAGFTIVDVLAHGTVGHVLGVGIVLGLKGTGVL